MYILNAVEIRRPTSINEANSTQMATNRTLDGTITRQHFGSNKRVWKLAYRNVKKTEYDTIKTIYDAYLSTDSLKTWEITETNYDVNSTLVHVDLLERGFSVKGTDYISDFDLTLTEA